MNPIRILAVAIFCLAFNAQSTFARPIERVGEVFIVGNTITQDHVIRGAFFDFIIPGQILRPSDVRKSELNIAKLGLFDRDPGKKRFVYVLDSPGPFKDILICVKEKPASATRSIKPLFQVRPDSGFVIGMALEERHFDLWRIPTCAEDILEGRAFRGAGEEWRFEVGLAPLRKGRFPFGIAISVVPPDHGLTILNSPLRFREFMPWYLKGILP